MKAFKAFIKSFELPQRSVKLKSFFYLFIQDRDEKADIVRTVW